MEEQEEEEVSSVGEVEAEGEGDRVFGSQRYRDDLDSAFYETISESSYYNSQSETTYGGIIIIGFKLEKP